MPTKSPSTCSNVSGEYELVSEFNSRDDLVGAMSFAGGRGLEMRWKTQDKIEKKGELLIRARSVFIRFKEIICGLTLGVQLRRMDVR